MGTVALQRIESAELEWRNGCPVSRRFGDIYFSTVDGLAESRHVFVDGNDLRRRWRENHGNFRIAETGFGSGLNFYASCLEWLQSVPAPHCLHYSAVEKHPLSKQDMQAVMQCFAELQPLSQELLHLYPPPVYGVHRLNLFAGRVYLTLAYMDIVEWLGNARLQADAWFLDGFAPASNPQMWSDDCLRLIAANTRDGGSIATFTAAGSVRRGLSAAGFNIDKCAGFGRKREMLRGVYRPDRANEECDAAAQPWFISSACANGVAGADKTATVVGAGLAGVFTADSLARRGWQVNLLDRHNDVAQSASGNPAAVIFSKFSAYDGVDYRFYQQAYIYSTTHLSPLIREFDCGAQCGVLQLAYNDQARRRQAELIQANLWPADWLQPLSAEQASIVAGVSLQHGGLFFPQGGWLDPRKLCQAVVARHNQINVLTATDIVRIEYDSNGKRWRSYTADGRLIGESSILVLASAYDVVQFAETAYLPLKKIRGQITLLPVNARSLSLDTVLSYEGYITPANGDWHCLGATFDLRDDEDQIRDVDNCRNIDLLAATEPAVAALMQTGGVAGSNARVGFRCYTPDYLPVVGPVPQRDYFVQQYAGLAQGQLKRAYPSGRMLDGLYVNVAHGARGVTTAPLAAEILAAYICNEVQPLDEPLRRALHPARFLIRGLQRGKMDV